MITPNSGIASFLAPDRSKLTVPLHALAPSPSSQFKWLESAEFKPQSAAWTTSSLQVPDNFDVKFEVLDS